MSETNREDGGTDEGRSHDPTPHDPTVADPTSGSSDWQPRSWDAPGSASSEQGDADLTQEVDTGSTQYLSSDAPEPQQEATPGQDEQDLSAGSPPPPPPPPPMPYPGPGQKTPSEGSPAFPTPGQPTPYGATAYPPPPAPGVGGPPVPPAPGAYGASPYGDPNAPYGAPPPAYYQQAPSQTNNSALVLTILSGIGIFTCCGVTIVSLILGILGLTKQASDPAQSAKLTKWGWIAFAVGLVLAVIGIIAYVAGMIALAPELYVEPDF